MLNFFPGRNVFTSTKWISMKNLSDSYVTQGRTLLILVILVWHFWSQWSISTTIAWMAMFFLDFVQWNTYWLPSHSYLTVLEKLDFKAVSQDSVGWMKFMNLTLPTKKHPPWKFIPSNLHMSWYRSEIKVQCYEEYFGGENLIICKSCTISVFHICISVFKYFDY